MKTDSNQTKINKFSYYGTLMWTYSKYQLLTKLFLLFIIYPIFKTITKTLILSTGRISITSGDYIGFLFSLQGFGLLLITILVLMLLIAVDINAFIMMSALIREKKVKFSVVKILLESIKSLHLMFKPSGLILVLYFTLVIPLVGIGLSISAFQDFKIPNFITDVIFNNTLYLSLYSLIMIILFLITFVHVFSMHYLIISKKKILTSFKASRSLIRKYWKKIAFELFIKTGLIVSIFVGIVLSILFGLLYYSESIKDIFVRRFASIFAGLTIAQVLWLVSTLSVPILCHKLTKLYYELNEKEGNLIQYHLNLKINDFDYSAKIKGKTKFFVGVLIIGTLAFNLIVSTFVGAFFEELFTINHQIDIVAHRGGGDLAAENTILGLQKAIEKGAKYSEIDVQRTKDNQYIINHDANFKRLTGVNKKAQELTLAEIKQLKVKDLFNENGQAQPVATLEEFLDAAKGKIGLFIELKGSTADEKMVDDVVKLVKAKNMEKEVAILSLDYKLIQYSELHYPELDTGYLYFFAIGETKSLVADILIMEEREATEDKVYAIQEAGKKAIVWTVNEEDSIKHFLLSGVDGIITDYVDRLNAGIVERDNRSDIQIVIDNLFGE